MLTEEKKKDLFKQGYRVVGNHSAIKVCSWTKKCIKGEDVCYKNTFYGINTNRCVQMTTALQVCSLRCEWCWRDINHTSKDWVGEVDDPNFIIDECIKEHVKYLKGFGGNKDAKPDKLEEAYKPKHFAISLAGEPTFYPKLPEFIEELRKRDISSFLVTNGTNPEMLKKLLGKNEPTQLYMTIPAPDKEIFEKSCHPLIDNAWEKIQESMALTAQFKRNVFRLTLVKDKNMVMAEKYAEFINKHKPKWVEAKAYVYVGYSQSRNTIENMPRHEEIMAFANRLSELTGYPIVDEKKASRVVLLGEKKDRKLSFE